MLHAHRVLSGSRMLKVRTRFFLMSDVILVLGWFMFLFFCVCFRFYCYADMADVVLCFVQA